MKQHSNPLNRRTFLSNNGVAVGSAALASMLATESQAANKVNAGARIDLPHHLAKAKRVIFLCMAGGPSHLETFDYKPELDRLNGQPMPASYTAGQPIAQLQGKELKCQGHLTKFAKHGQSGQLISDYLPFPPKNG